MIVAARARAGEEAADRRRRASIEVGWSVLSTPWGPIHIAARDAAGEAACGAAGREPGGAAGEAALVAVALRTTDEAFVGDLQRRRCIPARSRPGDHSPLLATAAAIVMRYAEGDAAALDEGRDLPLDLDDLSDWDRAVLGAVRGIPAGRVSSYGRIARTIGRTGAARAVGGAVGRNPIGLFIPCHRVIAGDGTLGGYGGSWFGSREENLELKRRLLDHEGVSLPATFAT